MAVFKAIGRKFVQAADQYGRRQAQRQLLSMSDRQLDDFGISRLKLLQGVSAWPWAIESDVDMASKMTAPGLESAPVVINVAGEQIDLPQEQRQVA